MRCCAIPRWRAISMAPMRTRVALLAVAAAWTAASAKAQPAEPSVEAARAVLRAVLDRQSRELSEPGIAISCVVPELVGTTIRSSHRTRLLASRATTRPTAPAAPHIRSRWHNIMRSEEVDALSPEEENALARAEAALRTAAEPPLPFAAIDPAWLLPPLRLCRPDEPRATLELWAPAIHRDIAFVEIAYLGEGRLYALRRTAAGWTIMTVVRLWIS